MCGCVCPFMRACVYLRLLIYPYIGNYLIVYLFSWCHTLRIFGRYDVLCDVITYVLISWRTLRTFWRYDGVFSDCMMYCFWHLWRTFYFVTYFWRHNTLSILFDFMAYLWRHDVFAYLFTLWHTFWHHDIFLTWWTTFHTFYVFLAYFLT